MNAEGKWILFILAGNKPKTSVWDIEAKDDHAFLGTIQWLGHWRGYAFYPDSCCVFGSTCLRDIADFIEQQNVTHKAKNRVAKEQKS